MLSTRNDNIDKNRYNYVTCNEVAVIFVGNNGEFPIERDIWTYSKAENRIRIPNIRKRVDPIRYYILMADLGRCLIWNLI